MSIRTRALFLTGLLAAVSCSDAGNPLSPEQPGPVPGLPSGAVQPLDCTVTVATGELRCELPQPDAGEASAAGQLIIGGQNVYVRLAASNHAVNADTIQFDVTVQNLIRQPLGTVDGSTVHEDGVRVFFPQDPVSRNPDGPASVANPDGEAMFIGSGEPYFEWEEMLAQDEVSGPRTWKLQYAVGSTSVSFRVYVAAQVQYPTGWIEIVPPTDTLLPGESDTLTATAYDRVGRTDRVDQVNFRWSTVSGSGVVTVDSLSGEVTAGASSGTDTVRVINDSGQEGFAVVVVNTPLVADDVTYPGLGNVSLDVPDGFGLAQFVSDPDGDAVSIVEATDAATDQGGLITVSGDGSFLYRPAAGFTGTDTYTYTATDGTAFASGTLTIEVGDRYWYAQADQAGTGTMASPGTLKTAEAGSAAGESIFVLHGGASTEGVDEGIVLKDGQALIGQGVSGSIVRMLPMPTDAADSLAVTLLAAGSAPGITRTDAGATVQLASGNTLRGLGISSTAGAGIAGATFGTLTTGDAVSISATGGAALLLSDGALAGTFAQVSSSGSTGAGLSLTNVTGTLAPTGGSITNPAGAGVLVSGGSVNLTWTGNVTQPNNAALVDVSGGHAGALEFNTGTVSATAGTGLQFNGVSGTYTFAGTTTLNGGDAGVDITNGSDGTFTFGTGTSITSPSGTAFNVYGSSPTVTYSGDVTKGSAGAMIEVGEQPGGSVTFQTGTLQATAGSGISLSNADGTVAFNGTTTLSGGPSVAVVGGSAGTISFASGASITNPSAAGILVSASEPTFTYAGAVTGGAARPAQVEGMTGGSVGVSGAVSGGAQGILVQNNNSGSPKTITFSGAVTLSTGANAAVSLANNAGATIGFTGGSTDLTTTSGSAFSATGGGTVNVTGGGNDISTQTGTALNLNGVSLGALGMSFLTVNVTGAAVAPVVLTNVGVTTGSTLTVSGGSIVAGNGTRFAVSGGSVNVSWMGNLSQSTHNASLLSVSSHTTGTLAFAGTLAASSGNGLQFSSAGGTYNFTGTTTLNGGDAGVDITGISNGTFSFGSGTSISNPTGAAFLVSGGSPTITFAGPITHNTGRAVSLASMGGSATFSGDIASSGASATGISVTSSSANVTFSGSSKTFSTQANPALTLTSNSGSILFSGGNLAVTTTSGAGIVATGTGTLQITGSNNTITTGTGTGFSLNGLGTGAGGITFRDIFVNGGTNGISIVNSSGAGFQVTGNGGTCTIATPTCSGGHVQNTSGTGVHLSAAGTVNLTRLRVRASGQQGIHVAGSTNLTLTSSYLEQNGNGDGENGLNVLNGVGSIVVNNSTFNGAYRHLVRVDNTNSNLTFTVQNGSVFEFPNPVPNPVGASPFPATSAILINPKGSSVITASVTNSTFRNIPSYSFQFSPDGSATATSTATFSSNAISADAGLNVTCASNNQCRVGNIGIGGSGGTTHAIVTNNTFNRVNGDGVFIIGSNNSSVLRGRFEGNSISNAIDDAIVIGRGQNSNSRLQFNNNTISNIGGDAFEVAAGEENNTNVGRLDLVITNHNISNVATNAALAAWGGIGIFRFGHSAQELCLAATGNTVTGSNFGIDFYGEGNFTGHGGSMVYEMAGAGNVTDADVAAANPGMTAANVITSGMTRSNGALCNRPGI